MKLNVFFFGLICHVSQEDDPGFADHATIVNEPQEHVPLLVWRDSGGNIQHRQLGGGGDILFSIDHDEPSGAAVKRQGLFSHLVVKLAEILPSEARIKRDVQLRDNHTDVAAYVVFPPGADSLRIGDFYREGGTIKNHGGGGPTGCIPRLTMTTIHAKSRVADMRAGESLVFEQDACILFSNVEMRRGRDDDDRPCHTVHYTRISTGTVDVTCAKTGHDCTMSFVPDECSWVPAFVDSLRVKASEFVECANTQWP